MQNRNSKYTPPVLERWPSAMAILTGLALILYLSMMLMTQNKAQSDVNRLVEKHIVREAQQLGKVLSFYFDQCSEYVVSMAGRHQFTEHFKHRTTEIKPAGVKTIRKAANDLLQSKKLNHKAIFNRILITSDMGHPIYDSHELTLSIGTTQSPLDQHHISESAGSGFYTSGRDIFFSTPILLPTGKTAGHATVWLNMKTIYQQFLANIDGHPHVNTLSSRSGNIFFMEDLPKGFRQCGLEEMHNMTPNILSEVGISCSEKIQGPEGYWAIKVPITNTPLLALSVVSKAKVTGITQPWFHAVVMATLTIIFISLFIIQLRVSKRHTELKTRYNEAAKQHQAMIENNEKLANEIILRKQAEAELKIINEHLEEIVRHRTSRLEGAMTDLRDTQSQLIQTGKLASIGELAAGIAHELNQPLMVIRGNAQLIARMMNKSGNAVDQLPSFFDTVERNTKRMIQIINHLRSFSRQSGTEKQSVDINQVINDAFLMIGEQLRLRNIETTKKLVENLPTIKGDPYQLEQVVLNLLSNARDAIESYDPTENGYRRQKKIEITTRMKNGSNEAVEILFSDNGCGIQQQDKEKIFDPFFTTKAVGKGTGLGLSISYGILQEHDGYLEIVDTGPGHTTFSVVLPVG